jgi:hypothetical protein
VSEHGGDAPHRAVGFVKYAKLSKQRGSVVVDLLSRQAVVVVEREDAAERKFNLAPGRRKPAPRAEVPPANDDLEDDGGVAWRRCTAICSPGRACSNPR